MKEHCDDSNPDFGPGSESQLLSDHGSRSKSSMEATAGAALPDHDLPGSHVDHHFLRGLWTMVLVRRTHRRAYAHHPWFYPNQSYVCWRGAIGNDAKVGQATGSPPFKRAINENLQKRFPGRRPSDQ